MKILQRLRALCRKEKLDAEMSEEMRTHLELQMRENITRGMSPAEAGYAAQRSFGGVEQMKERCRDERVRGFVWLEQIMADLRFAARALRKSPGFAFVAVLTVAIGIGANTSLFTAVNAVMLRPLPVPDAGRLVYVTSGRDENFSFPFYERLNGAAGSFAGLAAVQYSSARRDLIAIGVGATEVETISAQAVTGNFFTVLGVPAHVGRTLNAGDNQVGAAQPVVVISQAFWQRRFSADSAIVGKALRLDDVPVTVVGVMPANFAGFEPAENPDVWYPLQLARQLERPDRNPLAEGVNWLVIFGRLGEGITRAQAQAEVGTIFRRQLEEEVAKNPNRTSAERERILNQTIDLHSGAAGYVSARGQFRQPLLVLMTAVGVVLLIACTNVAGLLLARGAARQREFAVRAALGAGRGRIVRQLITESVLLAVLGGAFGLLFAHWGTGFLARYLAQSDNALKLEPDGRVLLFTIAVSLLTGLLFGLAPAWRLSRLDLVTAIKHQGAGSVGQGRAHLQPLLVIAQVALSVLLLAGAGLFARTLYNLRTVELGFRPENLVSFSPGFGRARPDPAQQVAVQRRLLAELAALPGVQSVAVGGAGLLTGNGYRTEFEAEGYTRAPDEEMRASVTFAGPRFFESLGVPLLRGRGFNPTDEPAAMAGGSRGQATVVIIGESLARKYFDGANPIGRHITVKGRNTMQLEIVGVAKDTRYSRNLREKIPLELYLPYFGATVNMPPTFYLRTGQSAAAIAADIRRVVAQVDSRLIIRALRSMDEIIDRLLVRERIIAQLVGFFSAFALLLASLGVYGILAYGVVQRTREIGLRMALGATLRDVITLVIRRGLGLVMLGGIIGMAASLIATRFVTTLLYGVSPADPATFAGIVGLLLAVATLAAWLPARRAAKIDPVVALRAE